MSYHLPLRSALMGTFIMSMSYYKIHLEGVLYLSASSLHYRVLHQAPAKGAQTQRSSLLLDMLLNAQK
jgi:hypothetical protein